MHLLTACTAPSNHRPCQTQSACSYYTLHVSQRRVLSDNNATFETEVCRRTAQSVLQRIPGPVRSLLYGLLAVVKALTVCAQPQPAVPFRYLTTVVIPMHLCSLVENQKMIRLFLLF